MEQSLGKTLVLASCWLLGIGTLVLVVVQAAQGNWYTIPVGDASAAVAQSWESGGFWWVAFGVFLGCVVVVFVAILWQWYRTQRGKLLHDSSLESMEAGMHPVKAEQDYVARYGAKAKGQTSMDISPDSPTVGVRIKAVPEEMLKRQGTSNAWGLRRLLSWAPPPFDPSASTSELQPSGLGPGKAKSGFFPKLKSIYTHRGGEEPLSVELPQPPTPEQMAAQVASPYSFDRAASLHAGTGHQADAGTKSAASKGPGLIGQLFQRKLEQTRQRGGTTGAGASPGLQEGHEHTSTPRIYVRKGSDDGAADERPEDFSATHRTGRPRATSDSGSSEEADSGEAESEDVAAEEAVARHFGGADKTESTVPPLEHEAFSATAPAAGLTTRSPSLVSTATTHWQELELLSREGSTAAFSAASSRRESIANPQDAPFPYSINEDPDNPAASGSEGGPLQSTLPRSADAAAAAEPQALEPIAFSSLGYTARDVGLVCYITVEEILPRPKVGLLSRMLRLAPVQLAGMEGMEDPIFLLHPGAEYHLNVILLHPPSSQTMPVKSASWIRIAPLNARAITLPITREEAEPDRWRGTATWDLSQHDSEALASGAASGGSASAPSSSSRTQGTIVPFELTVGFKCRSKKTRSKAAREEGARGSAEMSATKFLHAKILPRRETTPVDMPFSPDSGLQQFLATWNHLCDNGLVVLLHK